MYKNFWYVLAESNELNEKPIRVRALGHDFVLFRQSDRRPVLLSDICIHRMESLAAGTVEGDTICCLYHGWRYGEEGACTCIPANPSGTPVPKKARVDSYPVEERYGWVWGFLGDLPPDQRPPLPPFPEFEARGWRAVRGRFNYKAHYTRVIENAVDIAHTPFMHRNSFGNTGNPVMPPYDVIVDDPALNACLVLESPRPKGLAGFVMGGTSRNELTLSVFGPAVASLKSSFSNGWSLIVFFAATPVDENLTITRFVQLRSFLRLKRTDDFARKLSLQILAEDQPAVEGQHPDTISSLDAQELSTRADALPIEYRRMLRRYSQMGWELDTRRVRQIAGEQKQVRVIPCPARNDLELTNAWVLDAAPVVESSFRV